MKTIAFNALHSNGASAVSVLRAQARRAQRESAISKDESLLYEGEQQRLRADNEVWDRPHSTLRMKLQPGTCPFPVLGFWGKITMPNAGTMAYRRYLPSTTSI